MKHVEGFLAADLADDDAVGAHTQAVDDQLPLTDCALAFDVGRSRLEPRHMRLLQLKLGRVFDRDDALAVGDERRLDVEQRCLTGAGAAADEHVQLQVHAVAKELEHVGGDRLVADQVLGLEAVGRKTANRKQRAVNRQGRNDRIDARAIRQARIHHRRAVVDTAADAADDAIDDAQKMLVVLERSRNGFELAAAFHINLFVRVHQYVADRLVA